MKNKISLDCTYLNGFVTDKEITTKYNETLKAYNTLVAKSGEGNDFLGWVDYYKNLNIDLLKDIIATSKQLKEYSEYIVVVGIGGSFLGANAVINALKSYYEDSKIIFIGNSFSSSYLEESLEFLKDKEFSCVVCSKSGTTTESAIAFRFIKDLLVNKYGNEYNKRIVAITDLHVGALRKEVENEGYKSFVLPSDIGGRFSVFTPCGLLPIACSGIDIEEFASGMKDASIDLINDSTLNNVAIKYATIRNILLDKGKCVEAFISYEPKFSDIAEWLKQLFGESEGKENKGLFPTSCIYSRDLHSLGQYFQDGQRIMFETIVHVEKPFNNCKVIKDKEDLDNLNYLAGMDVNSIKDKAMQGTCEAHLAGGCPSLIIKMDEATPYTIGYLLYFFMFACGVSGYTLNINPFNQPGVEEYKHNMFKLLKKPGYED